MRRGALNPEFGGRILVRVTQGWILAVGAGAAIQVKQFPKPTEQVTGESKPRRYFQHARQNQAIAPAGLRPSSGDPVERETHPGPDVSGQAFIRLWSPTPFEGAIEIEGEDGFHGETVCALCKRPTSQLALARPKYHPVLIRAEWICDACLWETYVEVKRADKR